MLLYLQITPWLMVTVIMYQHGPTTRPVAATIWQRRGEEASLLNLRIWQVSGLWFPFTKIVQQR